MHKRFRAASVAALLALCAATASAGRHHICYEGKPRLDAKMGWIRTAIFACADDAVPGGGCTIGRGDPNIATLQNLPYPNQTEIDVPVERAIFDFVRAANSTFAVDITFSSQPSTTVTCEVTATSYSGLTSGAADGVLTGFSTDESGRVTTGVWRSKYGTAKVPGEFVVTGGGVTAASGMTIRSAGPVTGVADADRLWQVATHDDQLRSPREQAVDVIGLRIRGMKRADLATALRVDQQVSTAAFDPQVAAGPSQPGFVAVGGGFHANVADFRATVSAPVVPSKFLSCLILLQPCLQPSVEAWRSEATANGVNSRADTVLARVISLPPVIETQDKNGSVQRWEVRSRVVHATSLPGPGAAVGVGGLRGSHALTAVGAEVDWRPFARVNPQALGNRLVTLAPDAAAGGSRATSTATATTDPATVSAWAVGVKLVPEGTPPEVLERPKADMPLDVSWLCTSFPDIDGRTSLCKLKGQVLKLGDVCQQFQSELHPFGLCVPAKP